MSAWGSGQMVGGGSLVGFGSPTNHYRGLGLGVPLEGIQGLYWVM